MSEFRYDPGPPPGDNENWPDPDELPVKKCSSDGCPKTKPDTPNAYLLPEGEGWLDQRNGKSWCPDHIPAWYIKWKAEQR